MSIRLKCYNYNSQLGTTDSDAFLPYNNGIINTVSHSFFRCGKLLLIYFEICDLPDNLIRLQYFSIAEIAYDLANLLDFKSSSDISISFNFKRHYSKLACNPY